MALYKAILLLSVSWPACLIAQDAPADAASEPPAPPPVPPVPPANPPPAPPAVPPVPPPPTPAPPTPAPPTQAPPAPSPPPAPVVTTTADPHTMDKAFFNAARSGNADLAKELLAKKANVDYRDGERKTALCHAASQSHGAVVELLLANRADADAIDERGRSPLFFAAKFGHDEAVFMKILDAAKNLEVSNERGVTPLNIAVRTGKVHAVKALIARGADKYKGDSFGGHAFASAGNSDVDEIRLAFNLSKKTTTMAPVITTQAPRVLGAAKEL